MKILINTQYFWPETFRINDIVKFLRDNNHQVDVLTGSPNYPNGKLFNEYKIDKKRKNMLLPLSGIQGTKIYLLYLLEAMILPNKRQDKY